MRRNTVYLAAATRTQDLLNIKWTLKSAGYAIASTWHDREPATRPLGSTHHSVARTLEELNRCDLLVALCGLNGEVAPEVAMTAGFALAHGLRVIWIGHAVPALNDFQAVRQFNTAEDFRKQILQQPYSQPAAMDRLAA